MALGLRNSRTADPNVNADVEIRRPLDDPAYRAATDLLSAFSTRVDLLERAKLRLQFEAYFASRPEAGGSNDESIRLRLADLRADPPLRPAPAPAPDGVSETIARGLQILGGETPPPAQSLGEQIAEIDRQLDGVLPALQEQQERCRVMLGDLSFEICTLLVEPWNAHLISMYRCAQDLSRAWERFRDFHAAILAAGIGHRADILPSLGVHVPLTLGTEGDYNSGISAWRRLLEDRKLL